MTGNYDGVLRFDTSIDTKGFNQGTQNVTQKMSKLIGSLKAVGIAIAGAFVTKAIKNCINEAEKFQNALTGLESIMNGQGRSFNKAKQFIQSYTEDGLIPQTEAITAYKNLALRGYNTSQIEKVMTALKDSATYSRQSSYSLGEAVQSATEGLKNENSILVDNAGVTKNVAKMWEDYAKSVGKTTNNLTQQEKIQAEVNGILEETKFQTGDAATYANSYSGMIARLSASFTTLKQTIGGAFMQIFQAILPIIQSVVNWLIKLANVFASVVSLIFGKQVQTNKKVAQSSKEAAAGIAKQGNAAEKAGKQAQDAVLEFDKLNILKDDSSSSDSSGTSSAGGIDTSGLDTLDNLEVGSEITISPQVQAVFDTLKGIYEGFISWVNINFVPLFSKIGKQVAPKIKNLKEEISKIFSDFSKLAKPLEDYFNNNFTPFLQQIVLNTGTFINNMFDSLNIIIPSLWENVVYPFFEKFITVILPIVTDFSTQMLQVFQVLSTELNDLFLKIYQEGIEPALQLWTKIWGDTWDILQEKWNTYGKPIFDNVKEVIKNISDTWTNIWDNILKPLWDEVCKNVDWLWTKHLKPLVDNLVSFVLEFIDAATTIYNKFISPIINWLVEKLGPTFSNVFQTIVGIISSVLATIIDIVNGIITQFRNIIKFIKSVFTGDWKSAWQSIVDIFKNMFSGLGNILKGILNVVIDVINGALRGIGNGINGAINKINSVSSKVGIPAIPTLNMPQIPKLATGAVIPPNAEFMAILGDQKNGKNLEAPEGLIRQIVREETQSNKQIVTKVYLNKRQIAEAVNEINEDDETAHGDYTGGGIFAY